MGLTRIVLRERGPSPRDHIPYDAIYAEFQNRQIYTQLKVKKCKDQSNLAAKGASR